MTPSPTPEQAATPAGLLTVPQVAAKLAVDPATVRRWIGSKKLPAIKIGRDYRVDPVELQQLIAARRTVSRPLTTAGAARVTR